MKNLLILCLSLFLLGCPSSSSDETVPSGSAPENASQTAPTGAPPPSGGEQTLQFQIPGESGKADVKIGSRGEISTGSWQTRWAGSNVEVLSSGEVVVVIKQKEAGKWVANDANGQKVAKVKSREDGGYKVVDRDEKMMAKLKKREDGFKVVDSDEETVLFKAKIKDGAVKVKDGKEAELAKVRGTQNALFVSWMFLEKLPLPVRLGMATLTWSP